MASGPNDKRKHIATGRPHGGARPGAGKKPGTINAIPMGTRPALKALAMRVPRDVTDDQKVLLAQTEAAIIKVLTGKVHGSIASAVLLAARTAREEICGPITKKIEVEAKVGIAALLDEVKTIENEEKALAPVPETPKLPAVAKGPVVRRKAAESVLTAAITSVEEEGDETADAVEHAATHDGALP